MNQLLEHIQQRAEITPTLTAVRHSGEAVTFGRLDSAIADYSPVVTASGMSDQSAVVAGLLHSLPTVTRLSAAQIGAAMHDMLAWLSRDLDGGAGRQLRAV
ncbi:hypothetical protein HH308_02510 [Gordonia sp. TBRC 11910]|uniref:Uncharacterized protein n=1 Tax=Gordonia asplenii TaxID=2725283 RepID=A0A848KUB6_9ACTN|nr:hypothetical protein [Gordonia asplenii]NMO00083.1 hypothetical protein [Gordonia asplenii]